MRILEDCNQSGCGGGSGVIEPVIPTVFIGSASACS